MITTSRILQCIYCGRDLSNATVVRYVDGEAICLICYLKMNKSFQPENSLDSEVFCDVCVVDGRLYGQVNFCPQCSRYLYKPWI